MEPRAEWLAGGKGRAEQAIGHFIEPMACLAVAEVPAGSEWEYELKFDGYRAIAFKTRNRVHLASGNGKDFSRRFAELVRALEPLPDETVIDGEIVALDGAGRPSFNLLQNYATREYCLVFYVFDLLILAGERFQKRTSGASPQALAYERDVAVGRTNPLLGNDSRLRSGTYSSGTRARSGGRDRETPRQFVPARKTIWRVG